MYVVFYSLARLQKSLYSNWFKSNEPKYLSIVVLLVFLLFATQSVLNVDRSRSFYILAWIHDAPQGATIDDIHDSLVESFGESEARAFDQRLQEHLKRKIIRLVEFLSELYNLDGWRGAKLQYHLKKT
jgi:hypothetical protein